jgi:hypothetical protein
MTVVLHRPEGFLERTLLRSPNLRDVFHKVKE